MDFKTIKHIPGILALILLTACATYETKLKSADWAYYERWDQDDDLSLDANEFTSSYVASDFFSRWGKNAHSIAVPAFCDSAFNMLDDSRDGALDSIELSSRKVYYLVGDSIPPVGPVKITKDEFDERICRGQMLARFDKGTDQAVSETDMANAMFAICDSNHDGAVSSLEFYLWQVYRK